MKTTGGQEYTREGFTHNMFAWMPMLHDSNTNYITDQLAQLGCPEHRDQNMTYACPIDNVRQKRIVPENRKCEFK